MNKITAYLVTFLIGLVCLTIVLLDDESFIPISSDYRLPFMCVLTGGYGGIVYCLRGVYLNASVRKSWDKDWHIWYIIRPIISSIVGGASFLFLKAGLLVLESSQDVGSTNYGFLVLAFIAGLNVDKFINKVEEVAKSTFGIEKSRVAQNSESDTREPKSNK